MSDARTSTVILAALGAVGCGGPSEVVFLARSGCEACHRPVRPDGTPAGIEQAHPEVASEPLACVRCHGGDADARSQSAAHVAPGLLGRAQVRSASPRELDELDPDYLRFINPGDLRAAPDACGGGCHQDVVDSVIFSPMATAAGEIDVTRYRSGMQPDEAGGFGIYDAFDDRFEDALAAPPDAVRSLGAFRAAPVAADEERVGPYVDLLLDKACLRCHLWSFGDNRFDGGYRSSGCTACHMPYAEDGLTRGGDPMIDRGEPGRPERHVITTAIPTAHCASCHNGPSHLGGAFRGWRPSGAPGSDPVGALPLGRALYGQDASYFLTDEDGDTTHDETPADLHFVAGMHCVDCHAGADVHGDGRLRTEGAAAVRVRCQHCHGSVDRPALSDGTSAPGRLALTRDDVGAIWLTGRVEERRWRVPQIAAGLADAPADSPLARSHGPWPEGPGHTATLRCDACHSGWQSTCRGCHYAVDLAQPRVGLLDGQLSSGGVRTGDPEIVVDELVLMLDHEGRIAPSVPEARPSFSAIDGVGRQTLQDRPRQGADGQAILGQRAFAPHTTVRSGPWSACDRCHPGQDDTNARRAAGLAPGDALVDQETFEPAVTVGHGARSAPLPPDVIARMLGVRAP